MNEQSVNNVQIAIELVNIDKIWLGNKPLNRVWIIEQYVNKYELPRIALIFINSIAICTLFTLCSLIIQILFTYCSYIVHILFNCTLHSSHPIQLFNSNSQARNTMAVFLWVRYE